MRLAQKKVKNHKNFKVVGITGSYGKTTTKNILKHILGSKYRVSSTIKNYNSEIGIAISILKNLEPDTEIYIAEMGAYKIGEIANSCKILEPDVIIITGVASQHLDLFKSFQNIVKAKYEIIENAKEDAVVILNGDSEGALRVATKSNKKEIIYSTEKHTNLFSSNIKNKDTKFVFDVNYKKTKERFKVSMLGYHNISNILGATGVALQFNMKLKEIAEALKSMKNISRPFLKHSPLGLKILDDSKNSNPEGFKAALNVLDKLKAKRKILVTQGILELGNRREETYNLLSKRISKVVDIFVTSDDLLAGLVQDQSGGVRTYYFRDLSKQINFLRDTVTNEDILLLEGANLKVKKALLTD